MRIILFFYELAGCRNSSFVSCVAPIGLSCGPIKGLTWAELDQIFIMDFLCRLLANLIWTGLCGARITI